MLNDTRENIQVPLLGGRALDAHFSMVLYYRMQTVVLVGRIV